MIWNMYPYTDFHNMNQDWIIRILKAMEKKLEDFVATNSIKYANPFQWNITSQYEKNTLVIEPNTGTAYLSVQAVPQGVAISNTNFWTPVFDLSAIFSQFNDNITENNERQSPVSTHTYNVDDWLIWNDDLYKVISAVSVGSVLAPDLNIKRVTIEELFEQLKIDTSNSISTIESRIDNYKVLNVLDYGAVGNGVTDDTTAIQSCINDATDAIVFIPAGTFAVTSLSIPALSNVSILGASKTKTTLKEINAGASIFSCDQQFGYYKKEIGNITFDASVSNVTAFNMTRMRNLSIHDVAFKNIDRGIVIDRCVIANINNIYQERATANKFYSSTSTEHCFMVSIDGLFVDVPPTGNTNTILTFDSCVNSYARNLNCMGLNGTSDFVHVLKRCEGVFISDAVAVWPKTGFSIKIELPGETIPYGVWLTRTSVDQFTEHGYYIEGGWIVADTFAAVNSHDRSAIGNGVHITKNCDVVTLSNGVIRRNAKDGIAIEPGYDADKLIKISNVVSTDNGIDGGYDLEIAAAYPKNPMIANCTFNTHQVTGQIVNDDGTSSLLSINSSVVGNTATGVDETLSSYTMPANTINDINHIIKIHGSFLLDAGTHAIGLTFGGVPIYNYSRTLTGTSGLVFDLTLRLNDDGATWLIDRTATDETGTGMNIGTALVNPSLDNIINLVANSSVVNGVRIANYTIELI